MLGGKRHFALRSAQRAAEGIIDSQAKMQGGKLNFVFSALAVRAHWYEALNSRTQKRGRSTVTGTF